MTVLQELIDAVEQRRQVSFLYEGLPRLVQPAAVGVHYTTKNEIMRAYQVGGVSKSGSIPFWRIYTLSKISSLVTESAFLGIPDGYERNDGHMGAIYAQL